MPIQFRCNQCNQLLRVPDDSAGKTARCPNCQALMTTPAADATLVVADVSGPPPLPSADSLATTASPFRSEMIPAGSMPPKPAGDSPFADGGQFGELPGSLNPYASPAAPMKLVLADRPIDPRPVSADTIFGYAWDIWKANLGLLVLVTLIVGVINNAILLPFNVIQGILDQQREHEAAIGVLIIGQLVGIVVQIWLGIGQVQINLKLARRQPASFGDLFGGMGRFLPVLGGSIIIYFGVVLGLLLLLVPGIILMLAMWPFYYLLVDRKTGVMESFRVAYQITQGNWGSTFLLSLMSFGIVLLGLLACCVGVLFAAPLASMMFAVAYLMMSGQIEPRSVDAGYAGAYPQPKA